MQLKLWIWARSPKDAAVDKKKSVSIPTKPQFPFPSRQYVFSNVMLGAEREPVRDSFIDVESPNLQLIRVIRYFCRSWRNSSDCKSK